MSIDKATQYLIYDTSLQLLQQDLLTNSLFQGGQVGRSLRDMVLSQQPVQPLTNPFDEAITGTLRADARAVGQNARNVTEAAALMGVAQTGTSGILSALGEMENIIERINNNELDETDASVQDNFNDLRDKILGYIENTDYNGIFMLDSSQWGTEQIDSDGDVFIQAFKNGGFDIRFEAVDGLNFGGLSGASLETDLAGQSALVESLQSSMGAIDDAYSSRQTSLEFQAASLENQSSILDQAVEARRQTPTISTEDLLLNLVLRDSGNLVDSSG